MNNLEASVKSWSRRRRAGRVFSGQSLRSQGAVWLAAPAAVAIMTAGCSSSAAPSSTASRAATSVATHFRANLAYPAAGQTGSFVLVPEGHTRPRERTTNEGNVAFSPDGRYAVIASGDLATPWLLDVSTRKQVREFKGHTDSVRSVAFSPDGQFIATASYDHTARLWDVASGKQVRVFAGHTDGVADVAFSPDGRQLLTGSFDGKAKLWDVATGRQMQEFDRHHAGVVGVAFHLTAAKSSPVALTTRRSYPIYAAVPCCTLFRCSAGTGWRSHPTERTPSLRAPGTRCSCGT